MIQYNIKNVFCRRQLIEFQRATKIKTIKIKVTPSEKKKYVLSKEADFKILVKCKQLEKLKLNKYDIFLVKLIKTQLEQDWRKPLLKTLNQILKKYKER